MFDYYRAGEVPTMTAPTTTVKAKLRKLTDLDVTFVSLVDRGANRIPFRIVKNQESTMLNLTNLFRTVKSEDKPVKAPEVKPTVEAMIVQKADVSAESLASLKESFGFTIEKSYEDGTVALAKSEDFETGGDLVKMDDNMVLVIKGFSPWPEKLKSLPFGKNVDTQMFHDGVRCAVNVATDRIQEALWNSESPADIAKQAKTILADCAEYVSTIAAALPAEAFTMNAKVAEAVYKNDGGDKKDGDEAPALTQKSEGTEPAPTGEDPPTDSSVEVQKATPKKTTPEGSAITEPAEGQPMGTEPNPEAGVPQGNAPEASQPSGSAVVEEGNSSGDESSDDKIPADGDKGPDDDGKPEDGKKSAEGEAPVAETEVGEGAPKSQKEFMDEVLATIRGFAEVVQTVQALNGGMTNILKRVDELGEEVKTFKSATEEKIDSVVKKADTAAQAVRGTVLATDLGGDPAPAAKVQKSEDPRTGVFDTAFIRR
jgi:hypothetical protein